MTICPPNKLRVRTKHSAVSGQCDRIPLGRVGKYCTEGNFIINPDYLPTLLYPRTPNPLSKCDRTQGRSHSVG
ncbi:hypothetical protein [Moorena producens]|uniref:hypothetical protein n=1 Tax=Moorena producens TaxID=1155739 RepID=UPI0011EA6465|nr:hypothetical protein [Moorena producens]